MFEIYIIQCIFLLRKIISPPSLPNFIFFFCAWIYVILCLFLLSAKAISPVYSPKFLFSVPEINITHRLFLLLKITIPAYSSKFFVFTLCAWSLYYFMVILDLYPVLRFSLYMWRYVSCFQSSCLCGDLDPSYFSFYTFHIGYDISHLRYSKADINALCHKLTFVAQEVICTSFVEIRNIFRACTVEVEIYRFVLIVRSRTSPQVACLLLRFVFEHSSLLTLSVPVALLVNGFSRFGMLHDDNVGLIRVFISFNMFIHVCMLHTR